MPRVHRDDAPGAWHHLTNRGIARRAVFEEVEDYRFFLSLLAKEVRNGTTELHAYCLLENHWHLLIRSVIGELSAVMKRVCYDYVVRFNERVRRDGPLFRQRFRSSRIRSPQYWANVVNYIDRNAVNARLAARPTGYRWSSAWHYARPRAPRWLTQHSVQALACSILDTSSFDRLRYDEFVLKCSPLEESLMLARVESRKTSDSDLLDGPSDLAAVERWLRRNAENADGAVDAPPIVSPKDLMERLGFEPLTGSKPTRREWLSERRRSAGCLRILCRLTFEEIADRLGTSRSTAQRDVGLFLRSVKEDPSVRANLTSVTKEIVDLASWANDFRLPAVEESPRPRPRRRPGGDRSRGGWSPL
ncbi:MAG: hypothetical protein RL885_11220 [Planctomycetota bacterium]